MLFDYGAETPYAATFGLLYTMAPMMATMFATGRMQYAVGPSLVQQQALTRPKPYSGAYVCVGEICSTRLEYTRSVFHSVAHALLVDHSACDASIGSLAGGAEVIADVVL